MDSLVKLLLDKGFNVTPAMTGEYIRFDRGGKTLNGWFWGIEYKDTNGCVYHAKARFGDHVTKEVHDWAGGKDKSNMTPAELESVNAAIAAANLAHQEEKKKRQEQAAKDATRLYRSSTNETETHPYIVRKQIDPGSLARRLGDKLVIPAFMGPDRQEISSLQMIAEDGSKKFLSGGRLDLAWSMYIPRWSPAEDFSVLHIAEGYATAASIGMALHCSVLVAFNTSNMVKLCRDLKGSTGLTPDRVVICADNDGATKGNPGMAAAREARDALVKTGIECRIVAPQGAEGESIDFNDAHVKYGLEAVRLAILGGQGDNNQNPGKTKVLTHIHSAPNTPLTPSFLDCVPLARLAYTKVTDQKTKEVSYKPPSQSAVAEGLLAAFAPHLLREREDVFMWSGAHWVELDPGEFKHLIRRAGVVLIGDDKAKDKELNAFYNLFMDRLPHIPAGMSFFKQLPNVCNFLDGTLHMDQRRKRLEFLPHRREDFITWFLPHEYKAPRPKNAVFEQWLDRVFHGDAKKDEKIRALKQLGGACLVPINPVFGFFFGEAQSGKSTFANLCAMFVGEENLSPVSIHDLGDAKQVEIMINKRVNICTDIDSPKSVDSGLLKRITDARGLPIKRMYKKTITARLPWLHLYCGNHLPKGIDGVSGAMNRRVSIVEMNNAVPTPAMEKSYELAILEAGAGGVLDFFEDGLRDLLESGGFYFNPGKEALAEWKLENDPVGQFLAAARSGEVDGIIVGAEAKIRQHMLYERFEAFFKVRHPITRHKFYKQVRGKGYQTITIHGSDFFSGVGVLGVPNDGTSEIRM